MIVNFPNVPMNVDEYQNTVTDGAMVWTGSTEGGVYASDRACSHWTSNSSWSTGMAGNPTTSGSGQWLRKSSDRGVDDCNEHLHLYCFEQETQ